MTKKLLFLLLVLLSQTLIFAQTPNAPSPREHLLMDFGWRFAFGHPSDTKKDFGTGTGYFSYLSKTGYGDGAASASFDDRAWRKLDLPHDWAVEMPFSKDGSPSHGFKTVGRNFPETSVGWYRKTFTIPANDLGRRIKVAFDGVFRNSIVWVNGHYLGNEPSGYNGFEYDITDYLNYGGENVIAVRADATMEEGWFYEGAGIYRHVWLNIYNDLHIAANGTFVTAEVKNNEADVSVKVNVSNDGKTAKTFDILQTIVDGDGKPIASGKLKELTLNPFESKEFPAVINLKNPRRWSLETPYLHKLVTTVIEKGEVSDKYETTFGIRTIRFDANEGFFLNGKHIELKGTNNHQDHAGVGSAMPDGLQDFRIKALKEMGANAYRTSHNPPTPELLDACDRLGMLVIDENRQMGASSTQLGDLKRMMLRDRNHPSIIVWSIGNEEWAIEGNETGARIASTMQSYAKTIDASRYITAALSSSWTSGISDVIDVIGYNYIAHGNTDEHHKKFPDQPGFGTEEGSTRATRGIYFDDDKKQYIAAYDRKPMSDFYSLEEGWKYYAARPYLAGMFIWTGFDYRGEPTPFGWNSVTSYFGMMDLCGFPKDNVYYLKSWWTDETVLHILPHWNWPGKEGQEIDVWTYSNCDEVELFLNKTSLGKKKMSVNGHLEWKVKYNPGTLEAVGYKNGKNVIRDAVQTTSQPSAVKLTADNSVIKANKEDISVITIETRDKNNLFVPTADKEMTFSIQGPAKIIGVGNGNPISLEADRYFETINVSSIENLKEKYVGDVTNLAELTADFDDAAWQTAFTEDRDAKFGERVKTIVYRGSFNLPENFSDAAVNFFYNSIGQAQSIYINGREIAKEIPENKRGDSFVLDKNFLHKGLNRIAIIAKPLLKKQRWDNVNQNPGLIQLVFPSPAWKRNLFSGLAQIIIQSTGESGDIILKAAAEGLPPSVLKIRSVKTPIRANVRGL
ncbi:MAG: beta-galactosidase GalA [Actinomycetota bacterium]